MRECLAGNYSGWAALVEKHKQLVYSIPAKYQLPPEEAAAIFLEVWTDLSDHLGSLNREEVRSWLIATTVRRCLLWKGRHLSSDQPDW